jgi:dTDP-L-rhamnose 4-epimerase
MQRALVTGGAGFIGSRVTAALLRAGFRVRILDNLSPQIHGAVPRSLDWLSADGIEFQRGSVTSDRDLRAALDGVDAVIHLAAETGTGQSMYDIARYSSVNVQGTALLLDVLANDEHRSVRRVVLASSRSIYGEGAYVCAGCAPERRLYPEARPAQALAAHRWEHACASCGNALVALPTKESDPARPASIYAATKLGQEDLVRITCGSLGLGYAILRLQNVYGEGQSLNNPYTGILSIFSTRVRREIELPIFEDGEETRDFVHVEDVANAFVAALTSERTPDCEINVGSGLATSVAEIARQLGAAFGASPQLVVTGQYRLGDIRHNRADITLLKELLDYRPRVGLAEGLQRFAAWVRAQPLPEDRLAAANAELSARGMMGAGSVS